MHSDTLTRTQATIFSSVDGGDIKRTHSFVSKPFIFSWTCTRTSSVAPSYFFRFSCCWWWCYCWCLMNWLECLSEEHSQTVLYLVPILNCWCVHLLVVFEWIWVASGIYNSAESKGEKSERMRTDSLQPLVFVAWKNKIENNNTMGCCTNERKNADTILPPRQYPLNVNSIATWHCLNIFFIGWQKSEGLRLLLLNTKCARCSVRRKCRKIYISTWTIQFHTKHVQK